MNVLGRWLQQVRLAQARYLGFDDLGLNGFGHAVDVNHLVECDLVIVRYYRLKVCYHRQFR